MEKTYRWTVDVETDGGGRIGSLEGIKQGLPRILRLFGERRIKGLFFISTELIRPIGRVEIRKILDAGHELGSHGHFHTVYSNRDRTLADMDISQQLLSTITGTQKNRYRAPKFNFVTDDVYSNPKNHVSILKHMWLGQNVSDKTIIYLHPFDIVGGTNAPNLFCKLWYSRPKKAYDTFTDLLNRYPSSYTS